MVPSASLSKLPSTYNDFLYAPVGDDSNGALLTVLSVLARQNLDPWEEAADLSRLPRAAAAQRLISMIAASPGQSSTANQTAVADRLIALLPDRKASADGAVNVLPGAAVCRPRPAVNLTVIAIYIGMMLLSQWIAASVFEKAPAAVASSPPSSTGP
jgi:hypothetical protein